MILDCPSSKYQVLNLVRYSENRALTNFRGKIFYPADYLTAIFASRVNCFGSFARRIENLDYGSANLRQDTKFDRAFHISLLALRYYFFAELNY